MTKNLTTWRRAAPVLLLPLMAACGGPPAAEAPAPEASPGEAAPVITAMAEEAATTITAADIGQRIGILAADSMLGRDTPSPELEAAANYLSAEFRRMGLEPAGNEGTFLQRWEFEARRLNPEETYIRVPEMSDAPRYSRDFFTVAGTGPVTDAAALYVGVAGQDRPPAGEGQGAILVYDMPGDDADAVWQQNLVAAIQPAMMSGAAGVVVILDPAFPANLVGQLADATAAQQAPIPIVGVTDDAARRLFEAAGADLAAIRAAGEPTTVDAAFEIGAESTEVVGSPPNVVAMLPGSDPALRGTYVVLTAHFDHVGIGAPNAAGDSIYNGADDNASGTAGLLEVAEAFAALPEAPARSVLFLAVSGEEDGLLGSMAFAENPTVPMDSIVANVNADMIGRNAPDTVIGIGQEYSSLQDLLQEVTAAQPELGLNVVLDQKPEEMLFFRSDQLAFVQQGVPAVFFTTDLHEDYHAPSDEPAAIDDDKASRVAQLTFFLAYAIANDPEAPEWTEEGWEQVQQMLQQSPL